MSNYIIIGMPGSGKTTIGRAAATAVGKQFLDLDEMITLKYGEITDIFKKKGEAEFRRYETQSLIDALQSCGRVISTGGGIIEKLENLLLLKKNEIIFIDRVLDSIISTLDSESRPLLKGKEKALHELYDRRYDKYIKAMDHHVMNDGSFNECVDKVIKIIK